MYKNKCFSVVGGGGCRDVGLRVLSLNGIEKSSGKVKSLSLHIKRSSLWTGFTLLGRFFMSTT